MKSVLVRGRGWRRCAALVALTALVAAGCLGATASGSPSPLPATSPTAPASPSTATATSSPAAPDLSTVPLAPSGTWKSMRWVSVPATLVPGSSPPAPDTSGVLHSFPTFKLAGWSRGFVGFSVQGVTTLPGYDTNTTTTTTYSADGVHWHAGTVVQQQTRIDDIRGVFEGPAGLLAVEESGACGNIWVEGLLTSSDGVAWQAVDMKKAFGQAVIWNVSGGSAGFVATDTIGQAVWISRDGQSWQPVKLDTPAFARSRIDDGTSFSAGHVLVGSTLQTGARNCQGPLEATPPLRVPAVWWSSDGVDWVKVELPGAKPADQIQMSVRRVDDHTLVAFDFYGTTAPWYSGSDVWVSNDGRTWKPMAQPVAIGTYGGLTFNVLSDGGLLNYPEGDFLTDGLHGIQLQGLRGTVGDPFGYGMSLLTWADGGLVTLTQSGDQPPYDFGTNLAVGPTGVVVIDAGQLWIGLPSD